MLKRALLLIGLIPALTFAGVHIQQGDSGITIGSMTLTGASQGIKFQDGSIQTTAGGNSIQNTSTLQTGATFYVSSGTVSGSFIASNVFASNLANGLCVQSGPNGQLFNSASACPFNTNLLISTQTWTGQNNWTTPAQSTFTFGLTAGSITIPSLSNTALAVNANGVIISTTVSGVGSGLLVATQTWTGQNNWITPAQSSFTYGVSAGSLTLTGTGNFVFVSPVDGLNYQVMGSTETSTTINRFMVGGSSNTLINSTLRSTLVAVDSNGVAISSNPTYSGGSATPTGPNYAVQTSSNGSLGGVNNFQWNGSSISVLASSVTIKSGNPNGGDNASVGTFNIFNVGTNYVNMPYITIGSDSVGLEFSIAEQRYTQSKYGFRGSNLALDQAADNTLRSINLNNLIQIDNSGEMDIQTDNASNGGKNIVFKPGLTSEVVVSTLGVTASTNTAITTGYLQLYSRTKAQISAITPVPTTVGGVVTGQEYYCSDCTTTSVCISTGSAKGAFSTMANLTTVCN